MARILIIEDDRDISRALTVRLKSNGYEVLAAFDSAQGVRAANTSNPDLVILDITMPAGGGFLAAQRLRQLATTANLPIIFITASKDPELKTEAENYDPIAFMEKPFDSERLLDVIRNTVGDPKSLATPG